jgi:hypothetical protein
MARYQGQSANPLRIMGVNGRKQVRKWEKERSFFGSNLIPITIVMSQWSVAAG